MPDLKVIETSAGITNPRAEIDIPLNSQGRYAGQPTMISGISKVAQDVAKGLLTVIGTDFLAPNHGTNINALIGTRLLETVAAQLSTEVQTLLGYLAAYNIDQPLDEQLVELVDLNAIEDNTEIRMSATIRTGTNETATVTV